MSLVVKNQNFCESKISLEIIFPRSKSRNDKNEVINKLKICMNVIVNSNNYLKRNLAEENVKN